jgi:hypothetical protein
MEAVLSGKWVREPLLHFLFLGLMLFGLFKVVSGGRGARSGGDHRIVVSAAMVDSIVQRHQSAWHRTPTPEELKGLIDTHVREEILYREGVAMGLERDDAVVRRRVLQKLDVITGEPAAQSAPTDAELGAYLEREAARYAHPPLIGFEQVLFDPVRHGARLEADLNAALSRLDAGAKPGALGDSSLLPATAADVSTDLLARDYGDDFARAVLALPVGGWQGPVRSGFGDHLVRVTSKTPGRPATLAEVRAAVERDWENERRLKAMEDHYRTLRESYEVVVDAGLAGGLKTADAN